VRVRSPSGVQSNIFSSHKTGSASPHSLFPSLSLYLSFSLTRYPSVYPSNSLSLSPLSLSPSLFSLTPLSLPHSLSVSVTCDQCVISLRDKPRRTQRGSAIDA